MNTALLLAITFFAAIDTTTATPAHKNIDAILTHCEASNPKSATVAVQDGARVIVFQSTSMAVEVRASKRATGAAAANVVGAFASRVAEKKSGAKAA